DLLPVGLPALLRGDGCSGDREAGGQDESTVHGGLVRKENRAQLTRPAPRADRLLSPEAHPFVGRRAKGCSRASTRGHQPVARRMLSRIRAGIDQQLAQYGSMTSCFIVAVATDAEVRVRGEPREEREQAPGCRRAHLGTIATGELRPARVGPWLRGCPGDQRRARRQLRQPQIVIVEARVVALLHTARRTPDGAAPQPFVPRPRRSEPDDANHRLLYSASVTASPHFVSPPKPTLIWTSGPVADAPCQCRTFGPA